MRLWTLHPQYLSRTGLRACWNATIQCREVLAKGLQRNDPYVTRWINYGRSHDAVNSYLMGLWEEAQARGLNGYPRTELVTHSAHRLIPVSIGQVRWERWHLIDQLQQRNERECEMKLFDTIIPEVHPLFSIREPENKYERSEPERWERAYWEDTREIFESITDKPAPKLRRNRGHYRPGGN